MRILNITEYKDSDLKFHPQIQNIMLFLNTQKQSDPEICLHCLHIQIMIRK